MLLLKLYEKISKKQQIEKLTNRLISSHELIQTIRETLIVNSTILSDRIDKLANLSFSEKEKIHYKNKELLKLVSSKCFDDKNVNEVQFYFNVEKQKYIVDIRLELFPSSFYSFNFNSDIDLLTGNGLNLKIVQTIGDYCENRRLP